MSHWALGTARGGWPWRLAGSFSTSMGVVGRCMASAAKRPAGLAVKRDVAQRKERASYAAKRKKIVKAAGSVLKQYGLGGTTIEAIANEAGLGRATIYYYFADKGAIFGEVIHGGLAEMVAALEEVAASGDSPEVQLRSSIRVVTRAFEQHYPQLYVFFTEDSSSVIDSELHTEIIATGRRYEDLLDVVVRNGIRQGIFQISLPPEAFTKTVAGMLNWTSRWFVPGGILDADDVAYGMADTILAGVLVKESLSEATLS
jgi:TetR/AcrR family transcriptional regulator, cholesterol catabolism regulator